MLFEKYYLARFLTKSYSTKQEGFIEMVRDGRIFTLESFWEKSSVERVLKEYPEVKIFLDSGAYTMATKKVKDIQGYLDAYIDFALKYEDRILVLANLDDVYDVNVSWERQKYMENRGVKPIPVYHFKEPFKWLERYVNEYEYIGIGGVASKAVSVNDLRMLLDRVFDYMTNRDLLSVKVHGFGVAAVPFLMRYPWYSCDSTTWFQPSQYGKVFIPKYDRVKKKFDYTVSPTVVRVSELGMLQVGSTGEAHYTLEYPENGEIVDRIEQYFKLANVDKEALKTKHFEREKVNVFYFENLIKVLFDRKPTFSVRKSIFM